MVPASSCAFLLVVGRNVALVIGQDFCENGLNLDDQGVEAVNGRNDLVRVAVEEKLSGKGVNLFRHPVVERIEAPNECLVYCRHRFTFFLKLALLPADVGEQIGHRRGVAFRRLSFLSSFRSPSHVRTQRQVMPASFTTAINLAPCPAAWRSSLASRSSARPM